MFSSSTTEITQYGSHFVMTGGRNTISSKQFYLNIDTLFCKPAESGGVGVGIYTIDLPERLTNIKSISVVDIEIPYSFYNVSSHKGNNTLKILDINNDESTQTDVTIDDGVYTVDTIITDLSDAIGNTTYNNGIVVSSTEINSTGVYNTTITNNYTTAVHLTMGKLGNMLGFQNTEYLLPINKTLTSDFFINVSEPKYIFLVLDDSNPMGSNGMQTPIIGSSVVNKNIIARLSLSPIQNFNLSFGNYIKVNKFTGLISENRIYPESGVHLKKLIFYFIDEYGTTIDFNKMPFSFCLSVETTTI